MRRTLVLFILILGTAAVSVLSKTAAAQTETEATLQDQFFTGFVTAIDEESLTVNRPATGKNAATKTFVVTAATRFEGGRPPVRARVTVRYVKTDDGDEAVHIIVRRSPK